MSSGLAGVKRKSHTPHSVEYKFLNYHGERGARIHRDDSVLKDTIRGRRSLLFRMITPFLFFMPSVYMKEIDSVWIDDTVDWISWRKFITLLVRDWNQSITPVRVQDIHCVQI